MDTLQWPQIQTAIPPTTAQVPRLYPSHLLTTTDRQALRSTSAINATRYEPYGMKMLYISW
jgi:hypothetical protein